MAAPDFGSDSIIAVLAGTSTASCRVGLGTGDRLDSKSLAIVVGVAAPAPDEMRLAGGGAVSTD